jgi:hypothetical protein
MRVCVYVCLSVCLSVRVMVRLGCGSDVEVYVSVAVADDSLEGLD